MNINAFALLKWYKSERFSAINFAVFRLIINHFISALIIKGLKWIIAEVGEQQWTERKTFVNMVSPALRNFSFMLLSRLVGVRLGATFSFPMFSIKKLSENDRGQLVLSSMTGLHSAIYHALTLCTLSEAHTFKTNKKSLKRFINESKHSHHCLINICTKCKDWCESTTFKKREKRFAKSLKTRFND